jgi:hypothetical protein
MFGWQSARSEAIKSCAKERYLLQPIIHAADLYMGQIHAG